MDFNNIKRVHTTHKLIKLDSKLINEDENLLDLNQNKIMNEESVQVNLNDCRKNEKQTSKTRKRPSENNFEKKSQLTWENPNLKAKMFSSNKVIDYVNNVSINNSISKKNMKLLSSNKISNVTNSQNFNSQNSKQITSLEINSNEQQDPRVLLKNPKMFENPQQIQGKENLKLPPRHKKMHSRSLQSPNTLYPIYESEHTEAIQLNSNFKLAKQFAYPQVPFGTVGNNSLSKLNPYLSMQCFYPIYNPLVIPSNVVPFYCGNQKNVNLFINSSRNTNIHSNLGNIESNLKSHVEESDPISRRHNRLIQVRTNNNSVKQSSIKMESKYHHVSKGRGFASKSRMTNYDEIQSVNNNLQGLESENQGVKENDSKGLSDFNEYLNSNNLNINKKEKTSFESKKLKDNFCSSYKRDPLIISCIGNNNSNDSLIKTMNSNTLNNILTENVKADMNSNEKGDLNIAKNNLNSTQKDQRNENEIKKGIEFSITFGEPDKKKLESLSDRFHRTKANLINRMKSENNVKKVPTNIITERSKEEILLQRREMMRPKSKANDQKSQNNAESCTINISNQIQKGIENKDNNSEEKKTKLNIENAQMESKLNKKSNSNPPIELINRLIAGTKLKVKVNRYQKMIW